MKRVLKLPILMLAALALSCTSGNESRDRLTVYSPHGKEMMSYFESAFEKAHPGVDVRVIDLGSQDLLARISAERANPACDVWWGAPWYMFDQAAEDGLLEAYKPTWGNEVDDVAHDESFRWVGTFVMPQVILYNTDMLTAEQAPHSWAELTDPKWAGKIIVRYPPPSGTMRTIFGALVLLKSTDDDLTPGYRYLAELDRNTKEYASDPIILFNKISRQEGAVSLWNLTDAVLQKEINKMPFGYIAPDEGTPVLVDGIALVKGSPNPELAKEFYEFATSRENLILAADRFQRFPTRKDIAPEELPEWMANFLKNSSWLEVDWTQLAREEKEIINNWEQHIKGRGEDWLEEHPAATSG